MATGGRRVGLAPALRFARPILARPTNEQWGNLVRKRSLKSQLFRRANAAINQPVTSWAKHPEHMPLVILHYAVCAVASKFRLVREVQNPALAAIDRFTNGREIGELFSEPRRKAICSVSRIAPKVISVHRSGIIFLESPMLLLHRDTRAIVCAIAAVWALFLRSKKRLIASPAIDWRCQPMPWLRLRALALA